MSSDPSAAALERLDAAADDAQSSAGPPRDLADLAAALARVEALIAAGAAEGPDSAAAVERIADIAFVLHERAVEPSLCDALDAAVREISEAAALKRASVQRAREAADLLRELSHSLNEMVAKVDVEQQPRAAASVAEATPPSSRVQTMPESRDAEATAEDDPSPLAGLFDADMPEDDTFALTVAALAEALPKEAAAAEPANFEHAVAETIPASVIEDTSGELSSAVANGGHGDEAGETAGLPAVLLNEPVAAAALGDIGSARPGLIPETSAERALSSASVEQDRPAAVARDAVADMPAEETMAAPASKPIDAPGGTMETALPDRTAPDESSDPEAAAHPVSDHDQALAIVDVESADAVEPIATRGEAPVDEEQRVAPHEAAPSPTNEPPPSIDPDEDPGDLFEPLAGARPAIEAPTPEAIAASPSLGAAAPASITAAALPLAPAASAVPDVKPPQPAPASTPRLPAGPPPHAASRPATNDPLAPIRALSEEEMIALFS